MISLITHMPVCITLLTFLFMPVNESLVSNTQSSAYLFIPIKGEHLYAAGDKNGCDKFMLKTSLSIGYIDIRISHIN